MGRGAKHILYGLLFLFIVALVAAVAYFLFFRVGPSCEDGILNQEEAEIDCGGPCIACEIKNFELEKGQIEILQVGEAKIVLVATITNTNPNYGAVGVNYSLELEDIIGSRLSLIEGETTIPPKTTRYIVRSGLLINPSDVGLINFDVEKDFNLVPGENLVGHEVMIKQAKPVFSEGIMKIEGIVTNSTGENIDILKLGTLVRDGQGNLISAATTVVNELSAFKGKSFSIFVPIPLGVLQDGLGTEFFWEAI